MLPTSDYVIGDMGSVIELAQAKFPLAKIILSSVLPRYSINYQVFYLYNKSLKWLAHCRGVAFMDNSPLGLQHFLQPDGVHLLASGIKRWGKHLKNILGLFQHLGT